MEMGAADDATLLARWGEGDREAGAALFSRHLRSVLRVFRYKVEPDIEDLVQRTFLGCVERRAELRDPAKFRAFLLGIARYELLRHLEMRGGPRGRIDPLASSIAELHPMSPSSIVAEQAEEQLLARALRQLPIDQQIALELYYWEDLSGSELADVLGAAEGTVRSRLRLARARLRELLDEGGGLGDVPIADDELDRWARSIRMRLPAEG